VRTRTSSALSPGHPSFTDFVPRTKRAPASAGPPACERGALAEDHADPIRLGGDMNEGNLPAGPVPPPARPSRRQESHWCGRRFHPHAYPMLRNGASTQIRLAQARRCRVRGGRLAFDRLTPANASYWQRARRPSLSPGYCPSADATDARSKSTASSAMAKGAETRRSLVERTGFQAEGRRIGGVRAGANKNQAGAATDVTLGEMNSNTGRTKN
jgi:hypothetical protein